MKKAACAAVCIYVLLTLLQQTEGAKNMAQTEVQINEPYTTDTKIAEVISDPVFGEY